MSYYETLSADADSEQHTQEPLALRPLLLVPDFGDTEIRQGAEPSRPLSSGSRWTTTPTSVLFTSPRELTSKVCERF